MPSVFATAYLIGFVEWTYIEALRPHLSPEQRTVGTHVNLSHSAATPVGMNVICEGTHERFIIDHEKFMSRVQSKSTATN